MQPESQTRPFLTRFAVKREPAPDLPGRYCSERDVWVIDAEGGAVAAASQQSAGLATLTRVGGEAPDGPEFLLAAATETAVGHERPDHTHNHSLLEMATITEVAAEPPDYQSPAAWLEMSTITKVEGEQTD